MAASAPNKRAREEIAVPRFDVVDLEQFVLKDNGKGKTGHRTFPLVAGEQIRFNLTPNGWLVVPFGFDLSSQYEKPSFLSGEAASKASEGLSLRIHLQQDETDFLKKLDEKCKNAFTNIVSSCSNWNDLVAPGNMFCPNSVKVVVPLTGPDMAARRHHHSRRGLGLSEALRGVLQERGGQAHRSREEDLAHGQQGRRQTGGHAAGPAGSRTAQAGPCFHRR